MPLWLTKISVKDVILSTMKGNVDQSANFPAAIVASGIASPQMTYATYDLTLGIVSGQGTALCDVACLFMIPLLGLLEPLDFSRIARCRIWCSFCYGSESRLQARLKYVERFVTPQSFEHR